jgi:hypothetical protein
VHPALQQLLAQLDRERLAREYVLARLNRAEVEAMLAAIFAEQSVVPGELLELLATLTDGNPFFLEEVLKSLLTSGGITFTDSGWIRLLPAAPTDRQLAVYRRRCSNAPDACGHQRGGYSPWRRWPDGASRSPCSSACSPAQTPRWWRCSKKW